MLHTTLPPSLSALAALGPAMLHEFLSRTPGAASAATAAVVGTITAALALSPRLRAAVARVRPQRGQRR